jgi:branched-chain amino acid transport system substrate-binding protein
MATEELGLIAGSAADGTTFTFVPDPRHNPDAAPIVERFRAENFEPLAYTLLTYAAVQVWAQAAEKAGSPTGEPIFKAMHKHQFETVLGKIAFNEKGDVATQTWVWYVWKGSEYVPLQ